MRTVTATRYVQPLREGGSLPAIVEADDGATWVVKFHGAGQGPLALVAEVIVGGIAAHLGLPVPELVFVDVDVRLGRSEPDTEIRDLVRASAGINVGMRFVDGAIGWEPALAPPPDAARAADIVWLDALVQNVDRTPRNPNLLLRRGELFLIDHGAALYFHHDWENRARHARSSFPAIRQHVLLPFAGDVREADARLAPLVDADTLRAIVARVPDEFLVGGVTREGYLEHLGARLAAPRSFVEEAERARAQHV